MPNPGSCIQILIYLNQTQAALMLRLARFSLALDFFWINQFSSLDRMTIRFNPCLNI